MGKKVILFLRKDIVLRAHHIQIMEHGGMHGPHSEHLLDSALARPLNLFSYESDNADIANLAASYAYGIAKNHPFVDGNKRTALVTLEAFLKYNNYRLTAANEELFAQIICLASNQITEKDFAEFIRQNISQM